MPKEPVSVQTTPPPDRGPLGDGSSVVQYLVAEATVGASVVVNFREQIVGRQPAVVAGQRFVRLPSQALDRVRCRRVLGVVQRDEVALAPRALLDQG